MEAAPDPRTRQPVRDIALAVLVLAQFLPWFGLGFNALGASVLSLDVYPWGVHYVESDPQGDNEDWWANTYTGGGADETEASAEGAGPDSLPGYFYFWRAVMFFSHPLAAVGILLLLTARMVQAAGPTPATRTIWRAGAVFVALATSAFIVGFHNSLGTLVGMNVVSWQPAVYLGFAAVVAIGWAGHALPEETTSLAVARQPTPPLAAAPRADAPAGPSGRGVQSATPTPQPGKRTVVRIVRNPAQAQPPANPRRP